LEAQTPISFWALWAAPYVVATVSDSDAWRWNDGLWKKPNRKRKRKRKMKKKKQKKQKMHAG
jgi:hypothetical protein